MKLNKLFLNLLIYQNQELQKILTAITNIEVGNFTRVTNVKGTPDLSPFISGDVAEPYREIQLHSVQKTNYNTTANAQVGVARASAFEHSSGNDQMIH